MNWQCTSKTVMRRSARPGVADAEARRQALDELKDSELLAKELRNIRTPLAPGTDRRAFDETRFPDSGTICGSPFATFAPSPPSA